MKNPERKKYKNESSNFITESDLEWMRYYSMPRLERLRIKAAGKAIMNCDRIKSAPDGC